MLGLPVKMNPFEALKAVAVNNKYIYSAIKVRKSAHSIAF